MVKLRAVRLTCLAAAASITIQSQASAACWYPDEIVAAQVKDFQYMLMVGTLQCRTGPVSLQAAYNAFVTRQKGVLDSKGYVLKGHFLRENGIQSGRAAYDEFATIMSNHHAARLDDPSFCLTVAAYTRMATTSSDRDFIVLARSVVEPPAGGQCQAYAAAPADEPLPPPLLERREATYVPEPAYVAGPVYNDDQPPVDAPLPPRARPAFTPANTSVIADAPIVAPAEVASAPPSPQTSAQALQNAIAALQLATEALKASQAGPTQR